MVIKLSPRQVMMLISWAQQSGELKNHPITLSGDSVKLYHRYIKQLQESAKRKDEESSYTASL